MSYGSSGWRLWVLDAEEACAFATAPLWVMTEGLAVPIIKAAYDAGINTWDTVSAAQL